MLDRPYLALLFLLALPASGQATVWQRQRVDGTMEFTNALTPSPNWRAVPESEPGRASAKPHEHAPAASEIDSVVWTRERADGVVEFTNLPPVETGGQGRHFASGRVRLRPCGVNPTGHLCADSSQARYQRFDDERIVIKQAYFAIPQALIRAVIKTESDYDPHVVLSAGALGLMQLMPATARAMGVTNVWDPRQNIMGGARATCKPWPSGSGSHPRRGGATVGVAPLCARTTRILKVLAGDHAGPGAVERYGQNGRELGHLLPAGFSSHVARPTPRGGGPRCEEESKRACRRGHKSNEQRLSPKVSWPALAEIVFM